MTASLRRPARTRTVIPGLGTMELTPERPLCALVMHDRPSPVRADVHYPIELGVVIAGSMRRDHGAGWFSLGPGQMWAAAAMEPHWWQFGPQGLCGLMFFILPSFLAQMPDLAGLHPSRPFQSAMRFGPIVQDRRQRAALAALAAQMLPHYEGRSADPGHTYVDLLRILEFLSRVQTGRTGPRTAPRRDAFDALRVRPAIEMAERQTDRLLEADEAARSCHMAFSTFRRVFERVMGMSFSAFALRRRLAAAAHDLRATAEPIKAVALRFGFTDDSHFHRVFRAHYGLTPGRYRRLAAVQPTP